MRLAGLIPHDKTCRIQRNMTKTKWLIFIIASLMSFFGGYLLAYFIAYILWLLPIN